MLPQAVAASDDFDVYPGFIHDQHGLLGMRYSIDAEITQWLDPGMAALQKQVDALLPVTTNRINVALRAQTPYVMVTAFYITTPVGAPKKPLPMVVMVHGGPYLRGGFWNWNPETQFLASRGYVVLEPEFRGSTGYGARHFRAGWKQWAAPTAACRWCMAKNSTTPSRPAIPTSNGSSIRKRATAGRWRKPASNSGAVSSASSTVTSANRDGAPD